MYETAEKGRARDHRHDGDAPDAVQIDDVPDGARDGRPGNRVPEGLRKRPENLDDGYRERDERHAGERRRPVRQRDTRGEAVRRLDRRIEPGRAAGGEEARCETDSDGRDLPSLLLALLGRKPRDELVDQAADGSEPRLGSRPVDRRVELHRDEVAARLRILVEDLAVVAPRQYPLRLRHRLPPIPRRRLVAPALRVAVGEAVVQILDPHLAAAEVVDDRSRTLDRLRLRGRHSACPLVALLHDLPAALGAWLHVTVTVVALAVSHRVLLFFDHGVD